jgi:hypothetical protein
MRRIARWGDLPEASWPLIDALVEKRMLVRDVDERDGEVVVQVALDSLLRQRDDLAGWLTEERQSLEAADDILRNATAWEAHDRDPAWLLMGTRLAEAESLASTPEFSARLVSIRDYLAACRQAEYEILPGRKALRESELRDTYCKTAYLVEAEAIEATSSDNRRRILRPRNWL